MTHRCVVPSLIATVVALTPVVAAAQSGVASSLPRTAWGAPDLGGVWDFSPSVTRAVGTGATLRLTERFTRVSADTLRHEYTVDDPATFSRLFTAVIPLRRNTASWIPCFNAARRPPASSSTATTRFPNCRI